MPPNHLDPQILQLHQHLAQSLGGVWSRLVRLDQRLSRLEALDTLRAQGRQPRLPLEFRAQYGEDVAAFGLLGRKLDGFFIEVGAYDGYQFSATYALEALGWSGLLVEALPERAEACRQRRPFSRVVHAALGPEGSTGTTSFQAVDDDYAGMLSSRSIRPEQAEIVRAQQHPTRQISVPFTSLNALLANHTGPIDLAILDVEGGELDLLRGFDLARFRPTVLMIEDNSRQADSEVARHMARFPYVQWGNIDVNRVYIRADDAETLRRGRSL
jgi:FkbM family methyltransferase